MLFQWVTLSLILTAAPGILAQDTSLKEVVKAFEDANIPSNLFTNFDPTALLQVTFPQVDGKSITLKAGVQLPRNATVGPPTYRLLLSKEKGPFVIASVDPDAPTPQTPTVAQIRHFLGGNFFLRDTIDLRRELSNRTAAVSEYRQPNPPAGSPAHRYIWLVYKQPEGFNEQTLVTPTTSIAQFNISSFANAVGLGDPIAGTFMVVAPNPTA